MKRVLSLIMIFIFAAVSCQSPVFAEHEPVGETVLRNNLLFINGNSIPAAQLPNEFVYFEIDCLEYYGFDVARENVNGKKIYTVTRNDRKGIFHHAVTEKTVKVYTTDAEVYIESDIPANAFELENGTVMVQSDELAKYGTYNWDADSHTVSIKLEDSRALPSYMTFQNALGVEDINSIKHGVIVNNITRDCADIEYEDLKKWLEVYWNFNYDRVIAAFGSYTLDGEYVKLWNEDRSKSWTVYPNGGVVVGKYGEPYESHGEIKQNYVWYLPYIGNARNALNSADGKLRYTYLRQVDEVEFKGYAQREFTQNDDIEIPQNNVLITDNASVWARAEIEKAAACNLMVYDLWERYTQPITRYEFCRLVYRLIATEFDPYADSRMWIGTAIENIKAERGITERVEFSDCDYSEVEDLASMGIISGMGDGTFAPDSHITREQAATLLFRTAEFLGNKTMPTAIYDKGYNDRAMISDWAVSAVSGMKAMGIMQGVSETEFAPRQTYTVEQAIATMVRLYECN